MLIHSRMILRPFCQHFFRFKPIYRQNFRLRSHKILVDTKYEYPLGDSRITEYIQTLRNEYEKNGTISAIDKLTHYHTAVLTELFKKFNNRQSILKQLNELMWEMEYEETAEMLEMADEEKQSYCHKLQQYDNTIVDSILALNDMNDNCGSLVLEVSAGVGGQEAMLFCCELFDMYLKYVNYKRWDANILEEQRTDLGGLRHASILVNGSDAYSMLKCEGGVHRVQRVPKTEKHGRLQTSTAVVAIMPQLEQIDIQLNPKDLKIETKRASGPGGQNVNKLETAIRIVHLPTGVSVECQEERTLYQNKALALKKLEGRIYQKELAKRMSAEVATRKSQVGSGLRYEKVRTYNYGQCRVTDHRIEGGAGTIHNLDGFMHGNDVLDDFMEKLRGFDRKQNLLKIIEKSK